MPLKPVIINNWTAGVGVSKNDTNYLATIVGCDTFKTPGSITCSLQLTREDGLVVTELCKASAQDTSGNTYWFSNSSGRIWKRTYAGVWSLVHTNANITGHLGAVYYNGYIFYATKDKLGHYNISTDTWTDSFGTFTVANTTYKPMKVQRDALFIGDGYLIAKVDSALVFTANALDLPIEYQATTISPYQNDIVITCIVGNQVYKAAIFRWDTVADSWSNDSYPFEVGINEAFFLENVLWFMAGRNGNVYYYNGVDATYHFALKDDNNLVVTEVIGNGFANLGNHIALMSDSRGVFALGRPAERLPISQSIMFVPSQGQGRTVGTIQALPTSNGHSYTVLLSWGSAALGAFGVDATGTNLGNGFFITPVIVGKRQQIEVYYESLPSGTSIAIATKADDATSFTDQTVIVDSNNMRVYTATKLNNKYILQVKITLTASGTTAPVVREVRIT